MAGVNNNSSVVVVGRTAPVPPGQQTAANSVPVVIASDQSPIPVEEQNKQQSEVALSLLGIPRSEVALGIFADVNTYDINPSEWASYPEQFTSLNQYNDQGALKEPYENYGGDQDWGLTHISEEAGAMIEAPSDEYSILTSKRFFRYQPGRVSAATFGVKLNRAPYTIYDTNQGYGNLGVRNPSIKKYGIFDKFDGYYFESRNDGLGDNFTCVRRTQSIIRDNPLPFGITVGQQTQDYAWVGIPQVESSAATFPNAYEVLKANKRYLQELAVPKAGDAENNIEEYDKCRRDAGLVIEGLLHDLKYGGNASTVYNTLRFFNKYTKGLYLDTPATEIARYTAVRNAISGIFGGTSQGNISISDVTGITTVTAYLPGSNTLPSVESGAATAVSNLLNILINALGTAGYGSIPSPTGSAAGEMCVYRDGLIMTHAAAHDISLLKQKVDYKIEALYSDGTNTFKWMKILVPSGAELLQVGQSVYFNKNGSKSEIVSDLSDVLADGSIWYVQAIRNVLSEAGGIYQQVRLCANPCNEEVFTGVGGGTTANPSNPWDTDVTLAYPDPDAFNISLARNEGGTTITDANVGQEGFTLQTPTPFILPNDTRAYKGQNYTDGSLNDFAPGYADGAFPYVYPPGGSSDPNSVGYIDTAAANVTDLKAQINYVNKRLYKNWVWFNVDPQYYKVYEYRVPRTRFSGEKLNGIDTPIVYSDNVLDKTAGQPVTEETTGEQLEFESVWDLDPTKVTMYKIEFSWYGAVGATFLAYVPVENNEARWVRVHHLRASNQLKVASLGNATLPITYLVYGGGSENRYGYLNEARTSNTESGYGSFSEQLVKYGASYYIDGGDRGTVRLFSYASETLKEIGGSKYYIQASANSTLFNNAASYQNQTIGTSYINAPALEFNVATGMNGAPAPSEYYMNARVITGNPNDQDVRVIWADASRLYLSRTLSATSGNISLVVDRPQPLIGIKCRKEINGVRNRVQIYPTRLSTGVTSNSESLVVQLIKSPVFQTFDNPGVGATFALNNTGIGGINIGQRGKKTLLPASSITQVGTYLQEGQSIYGYFRYTVEGDTSGLAFTMLGLLSKEGGSYYFSANEVTLDPIIIRGSFLRAGRWSGPNPSSPDLSSITTPFPTATLSRLSAVATDTEQRSPIPGTGTVVTTIFSPNSGAEYNLQPYFDYNKDYLSFPLTDLVDTLYICASSKSFYKDSDGIGSYVNRGEILASITWEEQ
jgi:hypothetical protein